MMTDHEYFKSEFCLIEYRLKSLGEVNEACKQAPPCSYDDMLVFNEAPKIIRELRQSAGNQDNIETAELMLKAAHMMEGDYRLKLELGIIEKPAPITKKGKGAPPTYPPYLQHVFAQIEDDLLMLIEKFKSDFGFKPYKRAITHVLTEILGMKLRNIDKTVKAWERMVSNAKAMRNQI